MRPGPWPAFPPTGPAVGPGVGPLRDGAIRGAGAAAGERMNDGRDRTGRLPDGPAGATLTSANETGALVARLLEEMTAAWRAGERPCAEEVLARRAGLADDPQAAVPLIYREICLREECGQEQAAELVRDRFPRWQAELEALLSCHRLLQPPPAVPVFPQAGEGLGDFLLAAELGRGGLGRVFLATQPALADRPVVLKVTPRGRREHLALARLQHTHIVPLYSVHEFPARNLQALCMPYLGSATLAWLLRELRDQSPETRRGEQVVNALDRAEAGPVPLPRKGPARQFLARASYAQAVSWIGACLAEALHYAHERGLVHLDVTPSNVLLAADGQPMLLDFHLARGPLLPEAPPLDWVGGTHAYLSPEQRAALDAVAEGQPIPTAVGAPSDLYSLGLLLYEALGGPIQVGAQGAFPWLPGANHRVSVGLADVIHKCLAPEPRDRYPSAAGLAADLRRHLANLPLRGAGNRSLAERWRKWRRRRPAALGLAAFVLAVLAAAGLAVAHVHRQYQGAAACLRDGRQQLQDREYTEAVRTLTRGLDLAEGVPGGHDLKQELRARLRLAQRGQAARRREQVARDLSALADRIRFLYDPNSLSPGEARALEERCGALWEMRDLVLERSAAELQPGAEQRARTDLLDLAILWADLRVRGAGPAGPRRARQEALAVLDEAEQRALLAGKFLEKPNGGGLLITTMGWTSRPIPSWLE